MRTPRGVVDAWSPLPSGWLKMNTDTAVCNTGNKSGLVWILRRADHSVMAASANPMPRRMDVPMAEALMICEALSWIKNSSLDNVILESDADLVIRAMHNGDHLHFDWGLIVSDYCYLLSKLRNVRCVFVRRSTNIATDALAKKQLVPCLNTCFNLG